MNDAGAPHILIVEARFYPELSDALAEGALAALAAAGATVRRVTVPGALEIPAVISMALEAERQGLAEPAFDGFVALGCVIRGETTHYEIVSEESARGLNSLACRHQAAIGNGILTCETDEQAWERARMSGQDKGGGAARACLAMIALRRGFGLG